MSKSTIKRSTILLFVFVVSVALIAADLVVFAQNSNSSTTGGDQTRGGQMTSNGDMQNSNTGSTGRGRRRRRGSASANANTGGAAGSSDMTTMQGNANTAATTTGGGGRRRRRRRSGGTATAGVMTTTTPVADSVQTDLSGTYTGTLSCAGLGGGGEGTLTITGNQYTFAPTAGGTSISGRVVAVTTRGYTAVAMQYGESVAPPPGGTSTPPVIVSLRARKNGDNLSLTSIANGLKDCGFSTGGKMGGGRRRRRGRM
ncbi:MAG TPA: hypothetical protein VGC66_12930 [Pyrinomonadaceae bacterium]